MKNYFHQVYLLVGYFVAKKLVTKLHSQKEGLPNKKHTSERNNYSSMHGKQLVAFHVPQVLHNNAM
jgi:hypothetical protein